MARCVTVTGVQGSVRWGYHRAVELGAYTVTRDEQGAWSLSGHVVSADTVRASQSPLVFVAPHQDGSWRWPILDLQLADGALTARLGPKE